MTDRNDAPADGAKHSRQFKVMAKTRREVEEKYRAARERWERYSASLEVADQPLDVDIEISSHCNLDCMMCERCRMTRRPGNMSLDLFKAIVDECDAIGVDQVKLNLWGESLINPQFLDMVRYAKRNTSLALQFNTNANLLTEELARGIVEAGLDKMTVSFDGMTAPTYAKIRRKGDFDTVWKNVHRLLEIKEESGAVLPLVTLQILQTPDTIGEVDDFVAYWSGKADYVSVTNISSMADQSILDLSVREDSRTTQCKPCEQLWQRLSIYDDGRVTVCCSDYQGYLVIGKVGEDKLIDLWHGEKLTELRRRHKALDFDGLVCKTCSSTFKYE